VGINDRSAGRIDTTTTRDAWRDPSLTPEERVADLLARMSLREKVAQLYGLWVGADGDSGAVAPHQHDQAADPPDFDELIPHGLGQLTRPFGTAPVEPALGARALANSQRQLMDAGRFAIPAVVHEECLTGLAAWKATVWPSPLCWGASFDPALVEEMANRIGASMRRLGIHQGLAPVLDVVRDLRWGRVEETIGEDPHLVGVVGSAYVRGLQRAGIVATLKHFAGYSASRAGRNLAPVSIGPRELADVLLPPFEMALQAGARSVMNSYCDLDGIPSASDEELLTSRLRDTYGFTGTVVADYFSVSFLETLHGVAASAGDAAGQALRAGVDVELPTVDCYGDPLVEAVMSGEVDEDLVDRAATRVLRQKCELGLLDPDWEPAPGTEPRHGVLDDPASRSLAGELARRSIVLLRNDGALPLRPGTRVAVVGPLADSQTAFFGCYSFPLHVGVHHPDIPLGIESASVLEALSGDAAGYRIEHATGCPVVDGDDAGIAEAATVAARADVCVAVLGDVAGLFGRGTSGEGCDAGDLRLPGRQEELLEALLASGTPVVLILLVGRPCDVSRQVDRLAGALCGFFPGQAGGGALADILSGRTNPSGRLPVSFPGAGGSQPGTYLGPVLAGPNKVSAVNPAPVFAFGHGLSYAPAVWEETRLLSGETWSTNGQCELSVTLANPGDGSTSEVVQVYLHDPAAEVVRPVQQLIAFARIELGAGERRRLRLRLHADLTSFTGRGGERIVDPGEVSLRVGASSSDIRATLTLELTGPRRVVGYDRRRTGEIAIEVPR
jgi:beta-xylosidase